MSEQAFYHPGNREMRENIIEEFATERERIKSAFQGVQDKFDSSYVGVPDYSSSADKIDSSFPDGNPTLNFPSSQMRRVRVYLRRLEGGLLTFHPPGTQARMGVQFISGAASVAPQNNIVEFIGGAADFSVIYIGTGPSLQVNFGVLVIGAPWLITHPTFSI